MKWIERIIDVSNYNVKTLWNDGIVREINLKDFLIEKGKNPNSSYNKLLDLETFKKVKCDGTTLCWENQIEYIDVDGSIKKGSLDIAPELLFEISVPNYKEVI
ncbi:MAG: DUF2442 domain-containing protein [Candidatus Kapabacteria bacterium]|nr:DUF2442 domain-containing protein [Candidatus Kapabacteria bacterium]